MDVLSISVTDTSDRADSFTFTVRDRHPERARFAGGARLRWMDDGLFDEGNEVEIQMGYVDNLQLMLRGDITAITPSFPESGLPTLAVRGFCFLQRLQRRRRSKPFKASGDKAIAEEIAVEMGLTAEAEDSGIQYDIVAYDDVTYATILSQRAQRIGYEVVVKDRTLYFQRPRYLTGLTPAVTLEWGRSLRSFNPSLTTYDMITEVKVRASQTSQGRGKEPLVGTAAAGDERVKMGSETGPQIAKRIFGDNPVRTDDERITSQAEANELALAQLETRSLGFVVGRGACIGDPQLRARTVIELKGLGQRFSGKYYVTSATHTIDAGGYRTDFEAKRNAR